MSLMRFILCQVEPLEERIRISRLTFLYKILNEHVAVPMNQLDLVLCDRPVRGSTTKQRLKIPRCASTQLLLSGTHYQTPSPHWLRHHPSEAICLLHHARRLAHSIAEISVRRLAIIIQIQIQIECQHPVHQYWYRLNSAHSLVYCDV